MKRIQSASLIVPWSLPESEAGMPLALASNSKIGRGHSARLNGHGESWVGVEA